MVKGESKKVGAKKLPGVLSFQRSLVVTDGLFFNLYENERTAPLHIVRHGIRGTQNINKKTKVDAGGSTASSTKRSEVSNIQTTDSAKLDPNAIGLEIRFDLRFVNLNDSLFACAPSKSDTLEDIQAFRSQLKNFIERIKRNSTLTAVANRYARNIANGRFLWRNRALAQSVKIDVFGADGILIAGFDALATPLNNFENITPNEILLGVVIKNGLSGDRASKLSVRARIDFGVRGPVEVHPSQNYLENKEKGFARPLYCVGEIPAVSVDNAVTALGQAALRDQKIGNALRTIDTWYPQFLNRNLPIPVEPNGACLDAQEFLRDGDSSGFDLMLNMSGVAEESSEEQFLLACIIRGGVYSGSEA